MTAAAASNLETTEILDHELDHRYAQSQAARIERRAAARARVRRRRTAGFVTRDDG